MFSARFLQRSEASPCGSLKWRVIEWRVIDEVFLDGGGGGGAMMAYTGRLRPKGVPFKGFRYMKGEGFYSLKYMKG